MTTVSKVKQHKLKQQVAELEIIKSSIDHMLSFSEMQYGSTTTEEGLKLLLGNPTKHGFEEWKPHKRSTSTPPTWDCHGEYYTFNKYKLRRALLGYVVTRNTTAQCPQAAMSTSSLSCHVDYVIIKAFLPWHIIVKKRSREEVKKL